MTSSPSKHGAPGALAARPLDGNRGHPVATRPTQSETEAAIRTLIAWLGDDPDRTDLQGTPARVATAFYDLFTGYRTDPVAVLKRSLMPEQAGGQLVMLQGDPLRLVLRTTLSSDHRTCPRSLCPAPTCGRHRRDRRSGRRRDPTAAGPGADYRADRGSGERGFGPRGRRRGDRSRAPVHDGAGRLQGGRALRHQPPAGLPGR